MIYLELKRKKCRLYRVLTQEHPGKGGSLLRRHFVGFRLNSMSLDGAGFASCRSRSGQEKQRPLVILSSKETSLSVHRVVTFRVINVAQDGLIFCGAWCREHGAGPLSGEADCRSSPAHQISYILSVQTVDFLCASFCPKSRHWLGQKEFAIRPKGPMEACGPQRGGRAAT